MSIFGTHEAIAAYPMVKFHPRPYHVSFSLDYNVTPSIPYVSMTFYPKYDPDNKMMGAEPHWHVPFTLKDCERLHKWLGQYINDRKGILR